MKITIETIPHSEQRYPTCGDWIVTEEHGKKHITVRVSEVGDWRKEMAVAMHEATEALLCIFTGIRTETVDDFDFQYEARRKELPDAYTRIQLGNGFIDKDSEPGDHPDCPYNWEHSIGSLVERVLIQAFNIDWNDHEAAILALE